MLLQLRIGGFAFLWRWLAVALLLLAIPVAGEPASSAPGSEKYPLISLEKLKRIGSIVTSLDDLGSVVGNPNKRIAVGSGEKVYIDVGREHAVAVGDRFSIVTADQVVYRPLSSGESFSLWRTETWPDYLASVKNGFSPPNEPLGVVVRNLGTLEVVELDEEFSKAVILESFYAIKAGDRLIAYQEPVVPELNRDYKPPAKDIEAHIVALKGEVMVVGLENVVYIDQGVAGGVTVGDRFEIYIIDEAGKKKAWYDVSPETPEIPQIPLVIGELQVVAAREGTSAAVIRKNAREILVGQRVRYVPR